MKLILLHGRDDPDTQMEERGFDGPILKNVRFVRTTYLYHVRVGFETSEDADKARELTGWERWDRDTLVISFHEDMIVANDKFYGDWECVN